MKMQGYRISLPSALFGRSRGVILFLIGSCILLLPRNDAFGQTQTPLEIRLEGKERLDEIMEVVFSHYDDLAKQGKERNPGEPKLKHWVRWAWYMSGRLGPEGEFVNITDRVFTAFNRQQKIASPRGTNANWTFTGPSYSTYGNNWGSGNGLGRVDRIAFHPTDPDIIYVGTPAGGLWRTTNGGTSWTPLTDFLPSVGISGIVVSHSNPNVLYVLTGDGDGNLNGGFVNDHGYLRASAGVFKSTDGGSNWYPTGPLANGIYYGYRLAQDPNHANTLIAATTKGLWRTTNGGNSWTQLRSGKYYDVEFKPGSSDRIYASNPGDILYSDNGGDDWYFSSLDSTVSAGGRIELAVTPAADTWVYALAGPRKDSITFNGLFLSINNGENFSQRTNTPNILSGSSDGIGDNDQSQYDQGICASPFNANHVVTAGIIIWKSESSGLEGTLFNLTTYWEDENTPWYVHPDIHDVAYNPLDGKLYACHDGGIHVSADGGTSWTNISDGIAVTQSYHMTGTSANTNKVLIGNQDNGVKLRVTNSEDFPHLSSGDGYDVAFAANSSTKFYATINKSVNRYWDNGNSSTGITPSTESWFKTVEPHTSDQNAVFVGSADTIFYSNDEGATWTPLLASGIWSLATCPTNSNRIYAAGGDWFGNDPDGEVARSDDLGSNWTIISGNPGFPTNYNKVTDLAVEPDHSGHVWATIGGFIDGVKVFKSLDFGNNWTDMSGSLPNVPVNCIAVDVDGTAYIGTDIGVYVRRESDDDWIHFSSLLPIVPITDIVIYNTFIRASTFGRGVWRSSKVTSCPIAQNISGVLTGDPYYEASQSVISTAEVTGGIGTMVQFQAGDYVRLDPGFTVTPHSQLEVYIDDCQ